MRSERRACGRRWALAVVVVVAGLGVVPAAGSQLLRSELRRNGNAVMQAFEPVRAVLQQSSAVLYSGRREIAYGVVVAADGWIVTKASEVAGRDALGVRVGERKFDAVEVVATDDEWDVALLRVDARDLVPVRWSAGGDPPQGTWVVTNGATSRNRRRALAGIISANPRPLPDTGGVALGVVLDADASTLKVAEVVEGGGAAKAGLKAGDVITALDGAALKDRKELLERIKDRKPGEQVRLRYRRGEEEAEAAVELSAKSALFADPQSRNDMMSGRFSRRRSGFPRVLQHDILGARDSVGGPLLDLAGECVGINIARANRAESFAIPAREAREVVERLRARANR